jgi:hypothetical protein
MSRSDDSRNRILAVADVETEFSRALIRVACPIGKLTVLFARASRIVGEIEVVCGPFVEVVATREDRAFSAVMTLIGRHVPDRAVAVRTVANKIGTFSTNPPALKKLYLVDKMKMG